MQLHETIRELNKLKEKIHYSRERYTLQNLSDEVACMETGLPDMTTINILIQYVM